MAITNGYCTLVEYKAFNKITSNDATDDSVIEDIIEGVSRQIDLFTRRTFYSRTETHYYDMPSSLHLFIEDDDLLTISTLTNGDTTVISSGSYKLLPYNSSPKFQISLLPTSGISWQASATNETTAVISVAGTWGFSSTTPDDIKLICMSESMNEYHRRFGENLNTSTTITASGVVLTPQGMSNSSMAVLKSYQRLV